MEPMKFLDYLQQPSSVYALMGLIFSTRTDGLCRVKDIVEWFYNQDVAVNVDELKERWRELEQMEFAKRVSGRIMRWKAKLGWRIGYVLTDKGDKATEAMMEAVNYIKKL